MNPLKGKRDQNYSISTYGLKSILQREINPKYPSKGITWTDDFKCELPVKLTSQGLGSIQPITIIQMFQRAVQLYGERAALSVKKKGKWVTMNYIQYFNQCIIFAKALIAAGCPEFTSVNIIGFNSPEWNISFLGSIFARSLPTGIYTTNSVQTCQFIAQNSQCRVLIAQNMEYAMKYIKLIDNGSIKKVILYNDPNYNVQPKYQQIILQWTQFMAEGNRVQNKNLQERMIKIKPGCCCTLVYTSGTTGMPKGVMLSHDNYTWTKKSLNAYHDRSNDEGTQLKLVSYLPLSHVAGQFSDIISPLDQGIHVYFAQPSALQGTLIQTLLQVRPTAFFSVPRVWQKIYDKMQQIAKNNGSLKTYIANWAKSLGPQGTIQEVRNQQTSFSFKIAKALVFNNVKKALGLDQCKFFLYGAAPLDPKIRSYFLSLNFFLINSYGMSESTGPQNFSDKDSFDYKDMSCFKQVGKAIPGTQIKIMKLDPKQQDGQICYRGRNIFMGYYKMAQQTSKTIDSQGYLHSGDMGKLDKNGVLYITGRVKELIITAGGENIPPVLIEQQIFANLPFINNVMAVGDNKKYLTCLIAIKQTAPGSGVLDQSAKQYFSTRGEELKTVQDARQSKLVRNLIVQGLKKANQKAISRAQIVQDFFIMKQQFSVDNGLLTPTLKLKRKQVLKRFANEIQQLYNKPKL